MLASRVLFAFIGVGLLVAGVITGAAKLGYIREAATARGTVLTTLSGGSHPTIAFIAASGQTVEYSQGGWLLGYHAGESVRVFYMTGSPRQTACMDAFGALWFTPVLLLVIGLALLIGGVFKV